MNNLIKEIQSEVESLVINNDDQLKNANELAKKCNANIKQIKADYKPQKDELNKQLKAMRTAEKQELEAFEKCKNKIKEGILVYQKAQEQLRIEQLKEAQEEQEEFGFAVTEVKKEVKLGGTHTRKVWKARVIDESKVPIYHNKMCIRSIDQKALNQIALYEKENAKVDGVEFYQEDVVVIR